MNDSWTKVLEEKKSELALIASWASQANLYEVRDNCRLAMRSLQQSIDFRKEMLLEKPPIFLTGMTVHEI